MTPTPEEMAASMIAGMKEKTGKTLPQWMKLAKASKETKHSAIVKHLKEEHGLTHGYANLVAHELRGSAASASPPDDLVAAQYSGKKESLKPIYDALMKKIAAFGEDVEVAPKKSYVSLRRNKQFALIQPSTATRVDVGINLKGEPADERLEASGGFNAMVSHRVRVTSVKDVDKELIDRLREAYQRA